MSPEEYKRSHDLGVQMLKMCKDIYRKCDDSETAARQTAQHYVEAGIMQCPVEDLTGMLILELMHHIKPNGELIE
jgi:hypothetical protein